jgi:alpha-amylase
MPLAAMVLTLWLMLAGVVAAPPLEAARPAAMPPAAARPLPLAASAAPWIQPPPAERWTSDPGDGVYYQVFVRSFQDTSGDGNGDLRGLAARLDHVAMLGATGLWLTPIHPSPSYHGYDVSDYRAIHPDFGTLADFVTFLDAAHGRDLRVVLDLVVNHTSREHPWFQRALAGDPAYRARYVWSDERLDWRGLGGGPAWHPAGDGTYYLGLFEGGMPDLDHRNPAVTEALLEIAGFWLELGVDGFRVDAIQHVIEGVDGTVANTRENYAWVRAFNADLRARHPGAFLIGETWTSTPAIAAYHREADLDMSLNYPLWRELLAAIQARSAITLRTQLQLDEDAYPPGARRGTFLANHDQIRPATSLSPLRRDTARQRLAAGLLLTLPGTPFVYYGEEIGLPNGPSDDDRDKRTPMRWSAEAGGGFSTATPWRAPSTADPGVSVAAQRGDADSLLTWYQHLIALRRASPALRSGSLTLVPDLPASLLAFWRHHPDERLLVVANLAAGAVEIPASTLGLESDRFADVLSPPAVGGAPGSVVVDGTGLRVLRPDPR